VRGRGPRQGSKSVAGSPIGKALGYSIERWEELMNRKIEGVNDLHYSARFFISDNTSIEIPYGKVAAKF